jgi:glycosyltransferase involved in cell wall biosynthesis
VTLAAAAIALLSLAVLAITLWNVVSWPSVRRAGTAQPGAVSILIPARDEADNIGDCLAAAEQQGAAVAAILVYDDRSTDATADIVRLHAAGDERIHLLHGGSLPAGWCGKTHACTQLAAAATTPWLLFLDADARLAPDAVPRLVAEAIGRGATLLSPWPAQTLETFWERAVMPMLDVMTFSLFPAPLSLVRGDPSLGLVHGACILADREAYQRVGTHEAIRDEILDDQRLAQLWRSRGERGLCLQGHDVVAVRMYRSLAGIRDGFSKNFYPAFRHPASFWAFLGLHAAIFSGPLLLLVWHRSAAAWTAGVALLLTRSLLAWRFRHPGWSVLAHPLAEAVLLSIALRSWWQCRAGGVVWKGRRYPAGRRVGQ